MAATNIGINFYRSLYKSMQGTAEGRNSVGYLREIKFYSGPQPSVLQTQAYHLITDNATSLGATLVCDIDFTSSGGPSLGDLAWDRSIQGVSRSNPFSKQCIGTGVISWARVYGGNYFDQAMDLTVSESGGGGDIIVDSVNMNSGDLLNVHGIGIKVPLENGTIKFNYLLMDALLNSILGDRNIRMQDGLNDGNTDSIFGSNCDLHIYSGTVPASVDDPATGTLLATKHINYTKPTSGYRDSMIWVQSNNSLNENSGEGYLSDSAKDPMIVLQSGTPSYFRWIKGSYVLQGTCGLSDVDLALDKATVVQGGYVSMVEMAMLPNI